MKVQWGGGLLSKRKNPKDLQRFTKNKKLKTIIIGSIIGIIIIIGGINLYRAFALYKVEQSFNVLNGVVPSFSKVYTEKLLHGADPVLDQEGELVPVKIDEKGNVTKANVKEKWYSYAEKEWANAVILTSTGKSKNYKEGATIAENDIESYFVWIPKYSYKLFDMGTYQTAAKIEDKNNKVIEIEFGLTNTKDDESNTNHKECATPMLSNKVQGESGGSGKCSVGEWMTHPAFLAFNTNGLWVGKFETSNNSGVQIKANKSSWRNISVGSSFTTSKNYKPKLLSHMMKNTEWGTVAYLTQSIYGRCNGTTCTEVAQNKNTSYITGMLNTTTAYPNSSDASTTGNNSGIFDMNGGTWEHQMSVANNGSPLWDQSGLSTVDDKRYYDVYQYGSDYAHWNRRILGDATGEMGPFQADGVNYISSYFTDRSNFEHTTAHWLYRGGGFTNSPVCGIFAFDANQGSASVAYTFRVVLAP